MTLVATDLDRTLIYSRAAAGEHDGTDLYCVELYDGAPLSFMTERATALLSVLAGRITVLPTTTRTIAQFRRIALPGAPWRYAVTTNGGHILVDGKPDVCWHAQVETAAQAGGASLTEVERALRNRVDESWVDALRTADGLFCYAVVRSAAVPPDFLAEWSAWCAEIGWNASQQGRKIYTMPDVVCKSRAVAEVRRRLITDGTLPATAPLLAAGDGALDADLLAGADAAIRPRHGELHELAWTHPGLSITEGSGIRAGEEILDWFTQRSAID
ncbi:HAD family hydrolase [Skermania piniformis]|uniref:HAD family hydrolase n=1 Tax=Skermania pinensis TaxID=39122 RepID=A0ABX8SBZ1_9ACTN|nr:HAD family hydrolase [Skermania piniformis]QXQ14105.1 HAD family hydrolase [Skermania piniformis]